MVELTQLMKGGRDMKKIFKYEIDNDKYIITNENGEVILTIYKNNLLLNGNEFYEGLFKNYKKNNEIEIVKENNESDDKLYHSIFEILVNIINNIESEINKIE